MRVIFTIVLAGGPLILAGCAADSHAPLPAFMRIQTEAAAPADPPPNIIQLVRDHVDAVFVAASNPRQIQVTPPRHELEGLGWNACVKAELTSATGRPLGLQTYRIVIEDGVIADRRRAEPGDNCGSANYQPI